MTSRLGLLNGDALSAKQGRANLPRDGNRAAGSAGGIMGREVGIDVESSRSKKRGFTAWVWRWLHNDPQIPAVSPELGSSRSRACSSRYRGNTIEDSAKLSDRVADVCLCNLT